MRVPGELSGFMNVQTRGEWPPGAWAGDPFVKSSRCEKAQGVLITAASLGQLWVGGVGKNATGKLRPQRQGKGPGTSCPGQQQHGRPAMEERPWEQVWGQKARGL